MDLERWQATEALFHAAMDLPPEERAAFVRARSPDGALAEDVLRLLEGESRSRDLVTRMGLIESAGDASADDPPDHLVGRTVGKYRLEERIASGGMGVVYRARRVDGVFEQQVAVKLIRAEAATREMRVRFEFERQALARLSHPNIATVLDGGTTEEGTPFLVMEFIDGQPLDRWCDAQRASLAQRVDLFIDICRAVHFAHTHLILHRDIKPANILVDAAGRPRLLDFGIARLLDTDTDGGESPPTLTVSRILTPEYASPEQLRGDRLTTASDVYSLGVVLYGLLTGDMPHRADSRSASAWERLVCEQEPIRPSTAVQSTRTRAADDEAPFALRCDTTPARLHRSLRGDLDRIILMALRKDPQRRYGSAELMAADLERYRRGFPILARDDSVAYRIRRFVGRNRLAVASASAVFLALLVGFALTWRASQRAREEAHHAGIEATSFRRFSAFLLDTFLDAAALDQPDERARAREAIERQAGRIHRQFPSEPHLRANMLDALGDVARRLAFYDVSRSLIDEALSIRRESFGADSLEVALSLGSLGRLAYAERDLAKGAAVLSEALDLHRRLPKGVHTDVALAANDLACVLRGLGRSSEAEALHLEALSLRRSDNPDELAVAESLNNLAGVFLDDGRHDRAAEVLREALDIRARILGDEHLDTLQSVNNLAIAVHPLEGAGASAALLQRAVAGYRELRSAGREGLERTLVNLGTLRLKTGEFDAAEAELREGLELARRYEGDGHPRVVAVWVRLGTLARLQGDGPAALEAWEQVRTARRELPVNHPDRLAGEIEYASALAACQRSVEARQILGGLIRESGADREWLDRMKQALDAIGAEDPTPTEESPVGPGPRPEGKPTHPDRSQASMAHGLPTYH